MSEARASVRRLLVLVPLAALAATAVALPAGAERRPATAERAPYIVLLEDSVRAPAALAERHAANRGARVTHVYSSAIKGYAAELAPREARNVARDPGVSGVEPDQALTAMGEGQEMSSALERLFASDGDCDPDNDPARVNAKLRIDCVENGRVDVDVAVLDEGIQEGWEGFEGLDEVDFQIERATDCTVGATIEEPVCQDGKGHGPEGGFHATAIAGAIATGDNAMGGVGSAPGARLWSVKVLPNGTQPNFTAHSEDPEEEAAANKVMSNLIAGIDWVHTHADEIEVANMALGCKAPWEGGQEEEPAPDQPACEGSEALHEAIDAAVQEGVVFSVAAGNSRADTDYATPQSHPDVINVSRVADFDGLPGGEAQPDPEVDTWFAEEERYIFTCPRGNRGEPATAATSEERDDTLGHSSSYGKGVEIASPSPCGGTSMASARAAGAAAVLASKLDPDSRADVLAIRDMLIETGNTDEIAEGGWHDPWEQTDEHKEPLLDMSDEAVFDPRMIVCGDADVDGDCRSDLVTVDSAGAKAYPGTTAGFDLANPVASLQGEVDPALLDGEGDYVVDLADVTGDGRGDLVTWKGTGGAWVYAGEPSGGFATTPGSASFLTHKVGMNGSGPWEPVAADDVNADGRPDLVAVREDGVVMTLLGTAAGKFNGGMASGGTVFSVPAGIDTALYDGVGDYFLDVIDVSGDGHADLVSMNTDGSAYVYKGKSDGTFEAGKATAGIDPIMDDGQGEEPVGLADVNEDGRADLLTLSGTALKLRLGKEDASFATATSPYAGSIDSSLLDGEGLELLGLLDHSRDGVPDLVAVEDDGDVLTYAGQLSSPFSLAAPTTQAGEVSTIRHGPAGQELAAEKPMVRRAGCEPSGCEWPSGPAESDVDRDGRSDLITVDSAGAAEVFGGAVSGFDLANPTPSLDLDPALLDGEGDYVLDLADVDGDGRGDLVTAGSDAEGISVHPGEAGLAFGEAVLSLPGAAVSLNGSGPSEPIAVADVTDDGHADIVSHAFGHIFLAPGRADGTFGDWEEGQVATPLGTNSALYDGVGDYFLDVIDVSGDGHADLVSMNTDGSAYVFKGKSDGTFEAGKATAGIDPIKDDGAGEEPVGLADVDGDARADLLTLSGTALKLRLGNEDASFATATSPYAGSIDSSLLDGEGLELIGLLDHSRDGVPDLVAVEDDGDVLTYRGSLGGTVYSLASPVTQSGDLESVRFGSTGHELVSEKPFIRRVGCGAGGCDWPPGQ